MKTCDQCGRSFDPDRSGWNRFCSDGCRNEYHDRKRKNSVHCTECGKACGDSYVETDDWVNWDESYSKERIYDGRGPVEPRSTKEFCGERCRRSWLEGNAEKIEQQKQKYKQQCEEWEEFKKTPKYEALMAEKAAKKAEEAAKQAAEEAAEEQRKKREREEWIECCKTFHKKKYEFFSKRFYFSSMYILLSVYFLLVRPFGSGTQGFFISVALTMFILAAVGIDSDVEDEKGVHILDMRRGSEEKQENDETMKRIKSRMRRVFILYGVILPVVMVVSIFFGLKGTLALWIVALLALCTIRFVGLGVKGYFTDIIPSFIRHLRKVIHDARSDGSEYLEQDYRSY